MKKTHTQTNLDSPAEPTARQKTPEDYLTTCAQIQRSYSARKALSNWTFNIARGCCYGCTFCEVPSISAGARQPNWQNYGIDDPCKGWGDYVLLRQWDENRFLKSLQKAERSSFHEEEPAGNRAVLYCSTTDPYQMFKHPDPNFRLQLTLDAERLVTRSLELIRDRSTLNVRIMTRSPQLRRDFDLFKSFGDRLTVGMSLPTLNEDLAQLYEPGVPSPGQRLMVLHDAKRAGLNVFVAISPIYPESDMNDLAATLQAVSQLEPITIFCEPMNLLRIDHERIRQQFQRLGFQMNDQLFKCGASRANHALWSLQTIQGIATELGVGDRIHLRPPEELGQEWRVQSMPDPDAYRDWLDLWKNRISEWPGRQRPVERRRQRRSWRSWRD